MNPRNKFTKGAIIAYIMHYASKGPVYGVQLKEILKNRLEYNISDGTLYPWLNRIAESGYLRLEEKNVEGKIRKYYSITEKGNEHLEKIKKLANNLYIDLIGK